ncbi:MAG: tRNA 2-thiouridine(34) synthase MnmA [Acidimicrobiia bacterium]|nr:tRNA 2-thiouridine(34) synthase MnmA [Acidimicrobiia bacterium]
MARVLVAMSGGVDSSVAAALLVEAGHDVTGVTLKLWGGEGESRCCSVVDVEDARRVAAQLDIPHYVFNFADEFERRVVAPYVDAYSEGRTPNPCVECNRTMKWGRLLERAVETGFDRIATGHHARIVETPDGHALLRGRDPEKDQSYVLYMLGRSELSRTLLPVGALTKQQVRSRAKRLGLRTADKSDSQDTCFVSRAGRSAFIAARVGSIPGPIVDTTGTVLGKHGGIHEFTVGQRRGLGVAVGERRYVVEVDAETATVTVGECGSLLRDEVRISDLDFVAGRPVDGARVLAQMRAHGAAVPARLERDLVRFDSPQPRVAPGQVVALYDGDRVIGGGVAA